MKHINLYSTPGLIQCINKHGVVEKGEFLTSTECVSIEKALRNINSKEKLHDIWRGIDLKHTNQFTDIIQDRL